MSNTLLETYVLLPQLVLFKFVSPLSKIICWIGLSFVIFRAFSWLIEVTAAALERVGRFSRAIFQTKEPFGLYGAILSTSMAMLALISFMRESDELELLLRCDRTDEYSVDENYVFVSTRCAVKNDGNVTSTIDTIEPTFYFSDYIDLARGIEDRSFHTFYGDPSKLLTEDFTLPQTLQPGITKTFNAKVAIPIGWWEEEQSDNGLYMVMPDIELLLSKFASCKESERAEECFYEMTGKYLPNYLYETIEYPGGGGSYQRINGVGISVSDFSYSAEVEVDLFTGLSWQPRSEGYGLLSDNRSFDQVENLRRPWWRREYTVWRQVDDKTRDGYSNNFLSSTLFYLSVALSLFGWVLIGRYLWRKAYQRAYGAGE